MILTNDIIEAFPAILKEKIKEGSFVFPNNTRFKYEKFSAYRCFFRRDDDNSPVNRNDFRSHAERGIRLRGSGNDKPEYYGTSLFCSIDELNNITSLNKPEKRIAYGDVYCEGGPILENERNSHICWWIFEIVDLTSFKEIVDE